MRLKIHFIIKPSNLKIAERIKEEVKIKFDRNKYQVKISESNFRGETKILAREAILNKTDLIVACGGDGTINEIINEGLKDPKAYYEQSKLDWKKIYQMIPIMYFMNQIQDKEDSDT